MRILRSLRKRLYRLRPTPLIAHRLGARWLLDPSNWIDNRILAGAPFEREQLALAKQLIAEHHIRTVIDIGANIGLYSVLLGRLP